MYGFVSMHEKEKKIQKKRREERQKERDKGIEREIEREKEGERERDPLHLRRHYLRAVHARAPMSNVQLFASMRACIGMNASVDQEKRKDGSNKEKNNTEHKYFPPLQTPSPNMGQEPCQ